jgi:hypothetical protein
MSTATALRAPVSRRRTEADGLIFTGRKPQAVVLQHAQPKPARVEFEELFGFQLHRATTGEHINIIRAWMRISGLPEINDLFSICEFASVFERYVRPRCHWRHYWRGEEHLARQFLAQWASALLPQIVN